MDYLITTEDFGRATVGDLRLYTVALPRTGRTRQAMRTWLDSAIAAYRKAPNDPVLRGIVWRLGDESPGGSFMFLAINAARRMRYYAGGFSALTTSAISVGWHWIGLVLEDGASELWVDGALFHSWATPYTNRDVPSAMGVGSGATGLAAYDTDMDAPIWYAGTQSVSDWNTIRTHYNAKHATSYPART